ncbi:MAG: D-2-hydroxyacid dehydrogenase [Bacteroidaceae bacterium]|nr:D-2-hydroxyacid dehydrogenase [Bacteroidaceae bacterium]
MKIVILDAYTVNPGDLTWHPLDDMGELIVYDRTLPKQVVERCKGAEVVLTNKVVLDAEILNQLPHLSYIGVLATGYNVVDLEVASRQSITVTNIPAYSTNSVAQMVWAHILNITNNVAHYATENSKGRWTNNKDFCYYDFTHTELAGKTMGIIGLGNTGMATARIAQAFGLKVIAYTSKTQLPEGMTKVTLDELFQESDILSLHCPLTNDTKGLVNRERLNLMKPSAILINTSRGPVINEADVADALNQGRIAAFGADVVSVEPIETSNPLLNAKNCFLTPHIAWATKEARQRLIDICVENVKAFVQDNPQNVVNER